MAEDRITETVTVPVSAERAFAAFVDDFANWWPREYTWGRDTLESIAIEGHEGGRCVEKGPHGFTCDWGRVIALERPSRLVFLWQINPDRTPQPNPARPARSRSASSPRTRPLPAWRSSTAPSAATARAPTPTARGMGSPQGWAYCLERYAASLG